MPALIYLLFFCSGLSGLVYQVIWVRAFGNVFGNTVYSASLVVAVFMLGLGCGSYVVGRWSDRQYGAAPGSLLRMYGYAELAIAAFGLLISLALPHLGQLSVLTTSYTRDAAGWYTVSAASYASRTLVAALLLLPITALMGGTLSLLIRHFVRDQPEHETWSIAALYAVNTAGAAAGCFLTDFWFVPAMGLLLTQMVAVGLNVLAGAGALMLAARGPLAAAGRASGVSEAGGEQQPGASLVVPTGVVLALSGFAALGLEIVWFRHVAILLGAFRAVFSLLLTVILIGIGLGSLAAAALQRRKAWQESPLPAVRWLLVVQGLMVVSTLVGMATADVAKIDAALAAMPPQAQGTLSAVLAELWFNVAPMLSEVAVPALLMGFSFPLANTMTQRAARSVGRRAGALYLANTAGAVAGALTAGFVLLPRLGIQNSVAVLALVAAASLVPLFIAARRIVSDTGGPRGPKPRVLPYFAAAVAMSAASLVWWQSLPSDAIITHAVPQLEPGERRLALSEGLTEVIAVTDVAGKGRRLLTNGHPMSATWPLSQRYMRALAHLPLLSMERPTSVLVIGFGVGNTTHAATLHPSVEQVEVADLSPGVLSHASYFDAVNRGVLADRRVQVYVNDGRHHLLMRPEAAFDLITLEPPPIGYAGVSALYSREFYELARARLKPGGYVSQWLPVYQVPASSTLAMIRAFLDVFPQAVLVSGAGTDLLLLGTTASSLELDPFALERQLAERVEVRADLQRFDLATVREIVGTFVGSARTLQTATQAVSPVTDDRPIQEYGVRSLIAPDTTGLTAMADLARVADWCPRCYENGQPAPVAAGLDLYLALLGVSYSAPPAQFLRLRNLPPGERQVAGSAYLGSVLPESAAVHNLIGVALASQGALDEATAEFRLALALAPDDPATRWHLGTALASRGALDEALGHLLRAVELEPANGPAHYDLARVLLQVERIDEAIVHLTNAATLMPDSMEVRNDLGVALAARGRDEEAMVQFEAALQLRPDNADARRNLLILRNRSR